MKLRELLGAIDGMSQLPQHPAMDAEVNGLTTNSHATNVGDVFI